MENKNNNNFYQWDAMLETGHPAIDEQHKQLLEALNTLVAARNSGKAKEELEKTVEFLVAYTIKHFNDEEMLQKKYNYPDYNYHKLYHEEFKKTVAGFLQQLREQNYSEELLDKVIKAVADWVIHHIQSDDFLLAAYIKTQENKKNL